MQNKIIAALFAGIVACTAFTVQAEDMVNYDVATQNDLNLDEGAQSNFYYDYCLYNPYDWDCLGGYDYPYYGGGYYGYGRGGHRHGHHRHHGHRGGHDGHRGGHDGHRGGHDGHRGGHRR